MSTPTRSQSDRISESAHSASPVILSGADLAQARSVSMTAPTQLGLVKAAEQALLGSLMNQAAAIAMAARLVQATDFEVDGHRHIWQAMLDCEEVGEPVTALTVAQRMERNDRLDGIGGFEYLVALCGNTTGTNVEASAKLVAANGARRTISRIGDRIAKAATRPGTPIADLVQQAINALGPLARLHGATDGEAQPIDWGESEAAGEPPPREWIVQDWLMRSGPSLFAGRGGIGKSLAARMLGATLSIGRDYIGPVGEPLSVLYWSCEDDADECRRSVWAIAKHLGVPVSAFHRFHVVSRVGLDNTLVEYEFSRPTVRPPLEQLRRQAEALQADVVILDNVAHLFGGNAASRRDVTHFVNTLAGLHGDRKVSTLLLHHTAKAADSEYGDSAAWENAVRMRWWLTDKLPDRKPDEGDDEAADNGVRYLCRRKANYSGRDIRRMFFKEGAILAETLEEVAHDYGLMRSIRARTAERLVLEAVRTFNGKGIHVVEGTKGAFLPKMMVEYKLSGDFAVRELRTAMAAMLLDGRLVKRVDGKHANRSDRIGLMVADVQDDCTNASTNARTNPHECPLGVARTHTPT